MNKISAILLSSALILSSGCNTLPNGQKVPDPIVLQLVAQDAAAIGIPAWLKSHPNDKPAFDLAHQSLASLVAAGTGDTDALKLALSSLPIDQLKSLKGNQGELIIDNAVTLIDRAGKELVKLDKNGIWENYTKPVAVGLLSGFDSALGPIPVTPPPQAP